MPRGLQIQRNHAEVALTTSAASVEFNYCPELHITNQQR